MLKIENLKKHFAGIKAVNDCSFEVEKGKITALIGPNGSGKTTFFNLICGVIKPDEGKIIFSTNTGNRNIVGMPVEKISNLGISRLFQQTRLFKNLTVLENLLIAEDNEDQKFWKNILGFNKFDKAKIDKANKILNDFELKDIAHFQASDLSFGQKRLVELARNILNYHTVLVLDEPVAGVNPKIRIKIAEIISQMKKDGETILLIEHDMSFTLGVSDKIIVMDAGKIVATGTPTEIRNNPEILKIYLGKT
jgi:ABC-type branched-subunit amino acid transport system ATPase component